MVEKERFRYIDALRGIAIAGVMIAHSSSITGVSGFLRWLTNMGGMGVQLFFVISAFTIFYSLSKSFGSPTQKRDFFIRRLFRIIPMYWLGIILYTAVYGLATRGFRDGPELWHYPFHIFLVNVLHPATSSSVVPGGWSISCEVLFYMIAPILFLYLKTNKRVGIFMFISIVAIPIANYFLKQYATEHAFSGYEIGVINNFFYRWLPSQLACFGFGILFYRAYVSGTYKQYTSNIYVNLALISFVSFCFLLLPLRFYLPQTQHIFACLFAILALLLSVHPWKLFVNAFTVFLGKISFSCYLIHFLVINQLYIFSNSLYPSISNNHILHFVVIAGATFMITIPLAYVSYQYVELNAVRLGRGFIAWLDKDKPVAKKIVISRN
jgi:peptidoglycan/LPS O-acetylase OafA/YrhL